MLVDDPQLAAYSPEPYLAVLQEVVAAEKPRAVLIGGTSIGWDLAPMLSARLNAPVGDRLQGDPGRRRGTSGHGVVLRRQDDGRGRVAGSPAILMVLPGQFPADGRSGKGRRWRPRKASVPLEPGAVRFEELILPEAGDVDITQQDILVAVGRGIQQKDNLELAEELAQAMGGAVCAFAAGDRPGLAAGDAAGGQVGHDRQAEAVSRPGDQRRAGALEGMKDSDLIIAVNTDPKAPDFRRGPLRRRGRRVGPGAGVDGGRPGQERVEPWTWLGPSCGMSRTGRKSRSTC